MTDPAAPEPDAEDASGEPTAPGTGAADTGADVGADEQGGGNREAAGYRVRLRETETERDQLRAQVDELLRARVEQIAGEIVLKPAALWKAGLDVAELLDDRGRVDTQKAEHAIRVLAGELGLSARGNRTAQPPGQPAEEEALDRLTDAFRPPNKRADDSAYLG